jgi:hypothetical protein
LWRILILRRRQKGIITVFSFCVSYQFSFKEIDLFDQTGNLLRLHHNDAPQFFNDYLIKGFHTLSCKTNPDIQYFKERNRLFIKH